MHIGDTCETPFQVVLARTDSTMRDLMTGNKSTIGRTYVPERHIRTSTSRRISLRSLPGIPDVIRMHVRNQIPRHDG